MMQKKFDAIPDEVKRRCNDELITLIEELTDQEIGVIAAEQIIDTIMEYYGPAIYNVALDDAKKLVTEKFADTEYELDGLKQST